MEESLEQIQKSKENPQRKWDALILLFSRWAEVDLDGALKRAELLEPSMELHFIKHEIFTKMIVQNPKEAALYYEQNRESLYAHEYYFVPELARQWARQAPEEAWEWLASLGGDPQYKAMDAFFSGLDGTPEIMRKHLDMVLSDEGLRENVLVSRIIQNWAKGSFKDTVNWIESLREN